LSFHADSHYNEHVLFDNRWCMNSLNYTEIALDILKKKGYRITKPRQYVVELLNQCEEALSAYEIKERLDATGERIDTVSIYRILETLEENHLIHRVLITGKVRKCQLEADESCQLEQADHCHHLLICQACNATEEVHCSGMETLMQQVTQQSGFHILDHRLEFVGLCKRCAPSQKRSSQKAGVQP
jgi:Fur family transcriptional regulator, ferric uptake regulator